MWPNQVRIEFGVCRGDFSEGYRDDRGGVVVSAECEPLGSIYGSECVSRLIRIGKTAEIISTCAIIGVTHPLQHEICLICLRKRVHLEAGVKGLWFSIGKDATAGGGAY